MTDEYWQERRTQSAPAIKRARGWLKTAPSQRTNGAPVMRDLIRELKYWMDAHSSLLEITDNNQAKVEQLEKEIITMRERCLAFHASGES